MNIDHLAQDSGYNRDLVQQVLEGVVESALRETPFQRILAVSYDTPLMPSVASPTAGILGVAVRGLGEDPRSEITAHLLNGTRSSGLLYQQSRRCGRSYYYPVGSDPRPSCSVIPSSRRFMSHQGWQHSDILVVPFWSDGTVLGHISVDDPLDGAKPRRATMAFLEELASVAALALRDACSLEQITETNRLFRFLADCGMMGLLVVQDDHVRYTNDQLVSILGYEKQQLRQLAPWWAFVHPDDRQLARKQTVVPQANAQVIRSIREDGRVVWLSMCSHRMTYETSDAVAFQFYDITDRITTEELLRQKALRDPLTGLRNRAYFDETIPIEMQRSIRYKRPLTLMIADLTRFKQINDAHGHQEGDRVLVGVADVLKQSLRDSDWGIRYGGDEFLLVLPETGPDVQHLVGRLTDSVAGWSRENAPGIDVGIDFGWATWLPANPQSIGELIRNADAMLYRNKAARAARTRAASAATRESPISSANRQPE